MLPCDSIFAEHKMGRPVCLYYWHDEVLKFDNSTWKWKGGKRTYSHVRKNDNGVTAMMAKKATVANGREKKRLNTTTQKPTQKYEKIEEFFLEEMEKIQTETAY